MKTPIWQQLKKKKNLLFLFYSLVAFAEFVPPFISFCFKFPWNLNGLFHLMVMGVLPVFFVSMYYYLKGKKSLFWLNFFFSITQPFIWMYLILVYQVHFSWYTVGYTRLINHFLDIIIFNGVYALPYVSIVLYIVVLISAIVVIRYFNWGAGLSFLYIFFYVMSYIIIVIFYIIDDPWFYSPEIDKNIEAIAKTDHYIEENNSGLSGETLLETDLINARDLIAQPQLNNFFICSGSTLTEMTEEELLFVKIFLNDSQMEYELIHGIGAFKRAKLNDEGTQIYAADWELGRIFSIDPESLKTEQIFNLTDHEFHLVYENIEDYQGPYFVQTSQENHIFEENIADTFEAVDIMDFYVHSDSDILTVLIDTEPLLLQYKMFPYLKQLKLIQWVDLLSGLDLDFGAEGFRIHYDENRDSYFILFVHQGIKLCEIDAATLEIKQAGFTPDYLFPPALIPYEKNDSLLVTHSLENIMYEVSKENLEIINTYTLSRQLRSGYVDNENDLLIAMDYMEGTLILYNLVEKKIIHRFEIGRKPIAMDVHLDSKSIYFVSSLGLFKIEDYLNLLY